jgi:NAD(P)H dehydrogenase (quinone)
MNVFVVHAHHEPKSFNAAMTSRAREALEAEGHDVEVSDLYAMRFDPVSDRRNFTSVKNPDYLKQQQEEKHAFEAGGFAPDILAEMDKLEWCDCLILQFPLWWFGLPAIMKGWVDRVFAMGFAYGGGRWYSRGVFWGKRALLSLTTGGAEPYFAPQGLHGHLDTILYPIQHGILYFTGFSVLPPFVAWSVARLTDEERRAYLDRWADRLRGIWEEEPIRFPRLEDYDEHFKLKVGP